MTAALQRPRGFRSRAKAQRPLVSVEEAAELLGGSRSSLYRSISRGDCPLPVVTINGRYRIPRASIERLLAGDVVQMPERPHRDRGSIGLLPGAALPAAEAQR